MALEYQETMVQKLINRGKNIFISPQTSILSAASVISAMIVLSQIFGIVRRWIVLRYFGQETYALYLAAFRLPDLIFEILTFGALSSAFIPVFTSYVKKSGSEAMEIAGRVINIGLVIFAFFAIVFGVFSYQFYSLIAPGFSEHDIVLISQLARVIFIAQGFFIVSYVITGILESSRRFLVPALAPIFYYLGIILSTVIFTNSLGIYAPAVGAVIGALGHLLIQLPLAHHLGFKFSNKFAPNDGVREIGRLAAPRFIELGFLQILKSAELFFSSIISKVSYGYLDLANSLQAFPNVLFAIPLAKVAFISLSNAEDSQEFKRTFLSTLYQIMFFVIPLSTFLIVLRIPAVRLVYGTSQSLSWEGTLQTSYVLAAFAIGVPMAAAVALLSRAYYAQHDTKTPVILSMIDVALTIILEIVLIVVFHLPVWGVALANTIASFVQVSLLYYLLGRKLNNGTIFSLWPILKSIFASIVSGLTMFFLLKLFDKSVWVKRLSFLSAVGDDKFLTFQKFVLDTRYTFNLLVLTIVVLLIGSSIYIVICALLGSNELKSVLNTLKIRKLIMPKEKETVSLDNL